MGITFNVTEKSHVDHLPTETLNVVREIMRDGQSETLVSFPGFQIHSVKLPAHLDSVQSALRGLVTGEGPVAESDVFYGTRGDRPNISRLTKLPATQSRIVTVVVVGVSEDGAKGELATAYGGPLAPQEPGDPFLPAEKLAESQAFWTDHALSVDGSPASSVAEGHSFEVFSAPAPKTD